MASGAELPEYSSPSKCGSFDAEELVDVKFGPSDDRPAVSAAALELEGALIHNNRFAELSDNVKSVSTSSDLTNSSTPTRTDSMSDDTGFPLDTADEKDEVSSTVSNLSDISGISVLSDDGEESMDWRNASSWVQKQIQLGTDPRDVLKLLFSDPTQVPEQVNDITLWRIVINMMSEPPKRLKLPHINTISNVVELIKKSTKIMVLTGAGVSVSCGIPDFRSRDGIYSRLSQDFPDLPDPQAMFDINYFSQDPRPFYKFAREIYPGQFKPSPCHEFIKMLEKQKKLLRNYSQNIDTLERVAGIKNLIECHGSFATASCTKCKYQVRSEDVKEEIFAQTIPMCPKCQKQSLPSLGESNSNKNYRDLVSQGVMKPDIVFFGEGLPDAFHDAMATDKDVCDLLIVIGSSLKVRPVALIPSSIPSHVPQILINRESLPHLEFDIELLGDGDVIINQLCHMLDGYYKEVCWRDIVLEEATRLLPPQLPTNDSWDQSQDTLTNQDFSQDSAQIEQDSFLMESSSKRELRLFDRDDEDESGTLDDRPWKKIKTDSDVKELLEDDEPISCTKFYSNIVDYYEKKKNFTDEDASKNASSDSDSESVSDNAHNFKSHKASNNPKECKVDQKEKQSLDDRSWCKDENKRRKIDELNKYSRDNTISGNECMNVRNLTFHSEYTEHTVKNFTFVEKSHERQISFDSNLIRQEIESSPKYIDSPRKSITLSSGESPTTSYESSRITEEIYISEECHVVPRLDCLRDDSTLEGNLDPLKPSDKMDLKPRHASIDSVMDSALGDSCSSSDCQKRKNDGEDGDENKKFRKLDSHSWQLIDRESLASRLPENTYYQMKPGKYIFPGAEVYTNFPWNEGVLQVGGLRSALTASQLREH